MAVRRAPSPLPHRQPPSRRPSRRGARHLLAARVLLEAGAAEAHVAIGLAEVLRAPLSALEAHLAGDHGRRHGEARLHIG